MVDNWVLNTFLFFSACAFAGWIVESVFRTVVEGHVVNSGFLSGPFIPIYGFGALFITGSYSLLQNAPFYVLWPALFIVPSILEYLVSVLFEKVFKMKLWDYSKQFMNFQGRVCLLYSFFWLLLSAFTIFILAPFVLDLINSLDIYTKHFASGALAMYFIMDTWLSAESYFNFSLFLDKASELIRRNEQLQILLDSGAKLPAELSKLLKPMRSFPVLKARFTEKFPALPETVKSRLEKALKLKPLQTLKKKINTRGSKAEFLNYAKEIIETDQYKRLFLYPHHDKSIYEHSLSVAYRAFIYARFLHLDVRATVRGALLHDYYLYDWRVSRPDSGKRHPYGHAEQAYRNALQDFGPLTRREKDIIIHHMWPLTLELPHYQESWIVTISDKITATLEIYKMIGIWIRKKR